MGARAKAKAERRTARRTLDEAMTGAIATIDGVDYRYDPRQVNHAMREKLRKRWLEESPR